MVSSKIMLIGMAMAMLGNSARYFRDAYKKDPKKRLVYGYVNFIFAVALACCILHSFIEGLIFSLSVSILSASAPIVFEDLMDRAIKIAKWVCGKDKE